MKLSVEQTEKGKPIWEIITGPLNPCNVHFLLCPSVRAVDTKTMVRCL